MFKVKKTAAVRVCWVRYENPYQEEERSMLTKSASLTVLSALCAVPIQSTGALAATLAHPIAVEGGAIQGTASDTEGVTQFLGVPYAGNVGGANRWTIAPPVEPWEGVRVADTFGPEILQDGADPANADYGLNLNIWTPATGTTDNLPVYLLMHGGANRSGSNQSSSLQAAELAAKGVVVVSANYRLGPLGFMALPEMADENDQGAAGNYGVRDLVDALEWTRDYIAGFGGDPNTVTVGGQSAGGENAVALLRTPLAEGLFDRAVVSSSFTGFLPGKTVDAETKLAQNQAAVNELFGREMTLDDLRAISNEEWLASYGDSNQSLYRQLSSLVATNQFYTIDGHTFTDDSVNLLQPGDFEGLDVMIGQAADERRGLGGDPDGTMTLEEFREAVRALPTDRAYMVGSETVDVFSLYSPESELEAYRLYLDMQNDRMHEYVRIGAEYAEANSENGDIWSWYWDHAPPGENSEFRGAYHGSDIRYFNSTLGDSDLWTEADYAMQDLASGYLANFIKTGNPNGEGLPFWGQITQESGGAFMYFHDGEGVMRTATDYPSRDAYHRARVLAGLGWSEVSAPAPVPLPASAFLLLASMGGFAAIRRRKKAA